MLRWGLGWDRSCLPLSKNQSPYTGLRQEVALQHLPDLVSHHSILPVPLALMFFQPASASGYLFLPFLLPGKIVPHIPLGLLPSPLSRPHSNITFTSFLTTLYKNVPPHFLFPLHCFVSLDNNYFLTYYTLLVFFVH